MVYNHFGKGYDDAIDEISIICPECGKAIKQYSEQCPYCGSLIHELE